ncbi:hypothetical protein HMSSN036_61550 [Paenibacillus macerans]|nr:hypothetical protein HMSSN036_61550 [Paenibacillus macerans]
MLCGIEKSNYFDLMLNFPIGRDMIRTSKIFDEWWGHDDESLRHGETHAVPAK